MYAGLSIVAYDDQGQVLGESPHCCRRHPIRMVIDQAVATIKARYWYGPSTATPRMSTTWMKSRPGTKSLMSNCVPRRRQILPIAPYSRLDNGDAQLIVHISILSELAVRQAGIEGNTPDITAEQIRPSTVPLLKPSV
jgi:hypothetical protein